MEALHDGGVRPNVGPGHATVVAPCHGRACQAQKERGKGEMLRNHVGSFLVCGYSDVLMI